MKNCIRIFAVLVVALMFSSYVFAAETVSKDKTFMSLVKDEVCVIEFGTYGSFEKKMVNIDKENKTIDISLTAVNNDPGGHKKTITVNDDLPGEVVLLIDSSNSMNQVVGSSTRKQLVLDSTKTLVDKLFDVKADIKIGVVEFSSSNSINDGTDADAKKLLDLSSNKTQVKQAIDSVSSNGPLTDLDIGLKTAKKLFDLSSDAKKYLIVLTDGIPNLSEAVGNDVQYSNEIITSTSQRFAEIKNTGKINIISLLVDIPDKSLAGEYTTGGVWVPRAGSHYTGSETEKWYAEQIFGTSSNPKYGPVYYVSGSNVTSAIKDSIYADLAHTTTKEVDDTETYKLTDIVIKDYFPDEIVNNFDFSLVTKPSKGTISEKIDAKDNSITWTIPELAPKESTTLTYRLTLKENVDASILDKDLKTNKDVTIDCKEGGKEQKQVHNDKSPVVKLTTEPVPTPTPTPEPDIPKKDDTVAPTPIPQTGSYTWLTIGFLGIAGILASIFWIVKSIKLDKKPQ